MRKILLALSCLSLLAPMFLIAATSSAPYDAWSDLDADGDIDIFDIVKIAGAYGTTGDPGKNVNVTNWPTSTNVNITNSGLTPVPVSITGYAWLTNSEGEQILPPGGSTGLFVPDTQGYREVTVGIFPTGIVEVKIYWLIADQYYLVSSYTVYGNSAVATKLSVQGWTLYIYITNVMADNNAVNVDWYMTA